MTSRPDTKPRAQKTLAGIAAVGAAIIAGIGFVGSYKAVRDLAREQGFGWFSDIFPIGIDAGIVVLLALDMLLTWKRIPFPLLRQVAWLLTAATIAFNAASAWPRPLGVGMHAAIPVLFIVIVEASRHAVGRIADITADKHIEPVRITRWLLAPAPTFRLWRRMKLWELRSYEEVIRREQDRLVYRVRLRAKYGRNWRAKAPVGAMIPLRLTKYGVPLKTSATATVAICAGPKGILPVPAVAPRPAAPVTAEIATDIATVTVQERHEATATAATEAPQGNPAKRHRSATAAAKRSGTGDSRSAAVAAIRGLYDTLGRRPVESEMVAELIRIKSKHVSPAFAKKVRAEIEKDNPALAALGSDNVRPMTGS